MTAADVRKMKEANQILYTDFSKKTNATFSALNDTTIIAIFF